MRGSRAGARGPVGRAGWWSSFVVLALAWTGLALISSPPANADEIPGPVLLAGSDCDDTDHGKDCWALQRFKRHGLPGTEVGCSFFGQLAGAFAQS